MKRRAQVSEESREENTFPARLSVSCAPLKLAPGCPSACYEGFFSYTFAPLNCFNFSYSLSSLTDTLASGQLYLRLPSIDKSRFLNFDTNSVFIHSGKRTTPVMDNIFIFAALPEKETQTKLNGFHFEIEA